ncbi:tRNA uridine-5-carboxymethylaminomethyl(34) synthesis GTPase MnmE [Siculibacillus lacustris]|uniref:tRNA modification GTPase MnmE n=1 Tax=Siculibacillus lacustris TaxID=1549641 RepID=A0A4Q9VKA5_9HYPH|nr:tRNA uridine-5-carboxymethylaminomethyl(34) synthesis GTPase MnmE [Siculibacillus lacustris]TBW35803.1 tRNA uridine-5-carboxymethylaminomethyl(34) synthesis GTPase MnmE [Siculibacillus lacustris]
MDTIYALSSGGLPAAIAVIRVSGPACRTVLVGLVGGVPVPRRAVLRSLVDGNGRVLDRGLVLWFPGPGSATGEDLAELQVHGGRAVVAAVLRRLGSFDGVRPAVAGEFTRRALIAGRMDLTQVEGLADLLAAETEAQHRQALRQADGDLRRLYESWRAQVIRARALVEAQFDFSDEEDIPGDTAEAAWGIAGALAAAIRRHLDDGRRGERLRSGYQVVLMGPPNVGKSSLLNALARREAAIVTAEPGTTRDPIEVHLDLAGVPVTVIDTAGLRSDGSGPIEAEGMRRARARGAAADLVLWMSAPDVAASEPGDVGTALLWRVDAKTDLGAVVTESGPERYDRRFAVSVRTGAGVDALVTAMAAEAESGAGGGADLGPTRERHRIELAGTAAALDSAALRADLPAELRAEDLRTAADRLGRLTGAIGVDDLLDVIFGEFCIGK